MVDHSDTIAALGSMKRLVRVGDEAVLDAAIAGLRQAELQAGQIEALRLRVRRTCRALKDDISQKAINEGES